MLQQQHQQPNGHADADAAAVTAERTETELEIKEALRARADQMAAGTYMVDPDEAAAQSVQSTGLVESQQQQQQQQLSQRVTKGKRSRRPQVSVSLSTEGAVQQRLEEAAREAERERATAAQQLGLHDPANLPDPNADDTIEVEDEAQMLDVMLTHLVTMKNPLGDICFPAYAHEPLKDAIVQRLSEVMTPYEGPLLSQYQLSIVLQCLAFECIPPLLTSHEDIVQVLCPEAPALGEEMDLEQFPQRGTVYSREFVSHNGKEAIKMHLKFPNGQTVDLDFVIEREAPQIQDILDEIANGRIPEEAPVGHAPDGQVPGLSK